MSLAPKGATMKKRSCPKCNESENVIKKGRYRLRLSKHKIVRRYLCKACLKNFTSQIFHLSYRQKKPQINQPLFRLLNSHVSQRRAAFILGVQPITVARRIRRFGAFSRHFHKQDLIASKPAKTVVFD